MNENEKELFKGNNRKQLKNYKLEFGSSLFTNDIFRL